MALVLCTGVDPVLMKTRQLILEAAGHTVIPAVDERKVKAVCSLHKFDVAVIGQTLAPKMKVHVLELVREHCPTAKILELYSVNESKALEDVDAWLAMPTGRPEELLDAVNALALKQKK